MYTFRLTFKNISICLGRVVYTRVDLAVSPVRVLRYSSHSLIPYHRVVRKHLKCTYPEQDDSTTISCFTNYFPLTPQKNEWKPKWKPECCCCFLTLTDPLRIQPWSQDRRNQTKSNRESEMSMESIQKRTGKK